MALDPLTAGLEFGGKLIGIFDDLFTSDEERLEAHRRLNGAQGREAMSNMAQQVKVIVAEAGGSWLAANWRPITMLTFVGLVVARWLGFTAEGMSEAEYLSIYELIKIGLGGYVVGRSAEKVAKIWTEKKG